MRKLCAVILSAVVWLVAAGTPASAAEHQSTLSAGYLQTHTDMPGSDDLKGINVKYRYEFTDTLGLVTSFSYANAKDEQKTHYSDTRWHEDSVRNRWFSMMAGPSVRVNEWFSAYAMAGVAYSRVSTFSGDYLRVTDNSSVSQRPLLQQTASFQPHHSRKQQEFLQMPLSRVRLIRSSVLKRMLSSVRLSLQVQVCRDMQMFSLRVILRQKSLRMTIQTMLSLLLKTMKLWTSDLTENI